ncbi:hypothetical protein ACE6H2_018700 [Prunus campanulata]
MEIGEARHAEWCHCGKLARMQTSWTTSNPGRRFLVCPKSKREWVKRMWVFFQWFDAEMCERSKSLIPGLLRKIDRVEKENANIRRKSKILWAAMLLSWLVVFAVKMN